MKKGAVIAIYLLLAGGLLYYRSPLLEWLQTESSLQQISILLLLAFIIALVPAIPYGIIAVLLGAKFGIVLGGLLNLALSSAAAVTLFIIVRYVTTPGQRSKLAGVKGIAHVSNFSERNPFIVVAAARMLPVVPAQVVNIYAAMTNMPIWIFAAATLVGKIPFILTTTVIGNQLSGGLDWGIVGMTCLIYAVFLLVLSAIYRRTNHR
ncbi:TVP38/TMEM64 family protein [Paenibacillus sp. GCM10027626]|uniref:TVP38/TMEM64 family protein n=1 Tax=Paenibacillus sp. GCM10027626 TaxID=3273411 RepID=UPI0036307BCE